MLSRRCLKVSFCAAACRSIRPGTSLRAVKLLPMNRTLSEPGREAIVIFLAALKLTHHIRSTGDAHETAACAWVGPGDVHAPGCYGGCGGRGSEPARRATSMRIPHQSDRSSRHGSSLEL